MDKTESITARVILLGYIVLGMLAGLAAAYGVERHQGHAPNRHWMLNRLLLMPMSAGAMLFAVNQFGLSTDAAIFFASLLSFLAYDAFQILKNVALRKARKEVEGLTEILADPATYTKIEPQLDEEGNLRELAVKVVKPGKTATGIKPLLKQVFKPEEQRLPNKLQEVTEHLHKVKSGDIEDPKIQS